ncbi:U32 family peptidase, partial [Acinetobacter baumannii]|nr:U32 family peptidase [Acinetobacter baumannii]
MAADVVGDLIKAGVSSLKIEGRMKTEYYVASVVSGYRHLIDDLYANNMELSEERMAYHKAEIMKG